MTMLKRTSWNVVTKMNHWKEFQLLNVFRFLNLPGMEVQNIFCRTFCSCFHVNELKMWVRLAASSFLILSVKDWNTKSLLLKFSEVIILSQSSESCQLSSDWSLTKMDAAASDLILSWISCLQTKKIDVFFSLYFLPFFKIKNGYSIWQRLLLKNLLRLSRYVL